MPGIQPKWLFEFTEPGKSFTVFAAVEISPSVENSICIFSRRCFQRFDSYRSGVLTGSPNIPYFAGQRKTLEQQHHRERYHEKLRHGLPEHPVRKHLHSPVRADTI